MYTYTPTIQGMQWSTSTVLQETLQRAACHGLRCAPVDTLPMLRDVDTRDDLAAWLATAPRDHVLVQGARAALRDGG